MAATFLRLVFLILGLIAPLVLPQPGPSRRIARDYTKGFDVSSNDAWVNWAWKHTVRKKFVYIRATNGATRDETFEFNERHALEQGFIVGAYHVLNPRTTSGREQAEFFIQNGGQWSADSGRMPGAVDLEMGRDNENILMARDGSYRRFLLEFVTTYYERTGRFPVIRTTAEAWRMLTEDSLAFMSSPLYLVSHDSEPSDPQDLPASWMNFAFWQCGRVSDAFEVVYHGTEESLRQFIRDPNADEPPIVQGASSTGEGSCVTCGVCTPEELQGLPTSTRRQTELLRSELVVDGPPGKGKGV